MAGVSFDPASFDALIDNHGYIAIWKPAIVCECMEDGQPDIHCPLCKGSGFRYLAYKKIKVVSTSFSGEKTLKVQGLEEPGTVYITPQRGVIFGYHDKIEFIEITCKHSQTVTMRGSETTSTHRQIEEVSYVMGGNKVYEEGIDFEIHEGRHRLKWINEDTKPRSGAKISILYLTTPEYMVTDMMHELRSVRQNKGTHTPYNVDMPNQYLAKRLEFVYGETINRKREESEYSYD